MILVLQFGLYDCPSRDFSKVVPILPILLEYTPISNLRLLQFFFDNQRVKFKSIIYSSLLPYSGTAFYRDIMWNVHDCSASKFHEQIGRYPITIEGIIVPPPKCDSFDAYKYVIHEYEAQNIPIIYSYSNKTLKESVKKMCELLNDYNKEEKEVKLF